MSHSKKIPIVIDSDNSDSESSKDPKQKEKVGDRKMLKQKNKRKSSKMSKCLDEDDGPTTSKQTVEEQDLGDSDQTDEDDGPSTSKQTVEEQDLDDSDERDEEENVATSKKKGKKPQGMRTKRERKRRGRKRKPVADPQYEDEWTLLDKKRLLEGLKRYGPNNVKLLSNLNEGKSEMDIEAMLFRMHGNAACDSQTKDGISVESRAPIEKWILDVEDLVMQEPTDFSRDITQVLKYLEKYEFMEESYVKDLSWRTIYKYLRILSTGREEDLPVLSDIESLIMLELMTDLGKTMQTSNTDEQRKLLEYKHQMMFLGVSRLSMPRARWIDEGELLSNALTNNFEPYAGLLTHNVHGSTGEIQPTSSTSNQEQSSSRSRTHKEEIPITTAQEEIVSDIKLTPVEDVREHEHVTLKMHIRGNQTLIKPKLLTLNPLCIPKECMNIQPK